MKIKSILLALLLAITSFLPVPLAATAKVKTKTIVESDIVVDTIWTREMSPIEIRSRERNNTIVRVANGAKLTIEPGVTVYMGSGMTFQVSTQCLRDFGGECIADREGKKKFPLLIANGTSNQPIIFTSINDQTGRRPKAGDWGSFLVRAAGSEISWVKLLYGGSSGKRAFVELRKSNFKNNVIAHSKTTALYMNNQEISGNVIQDNDGIGLNCTDQCTIENNIISNNISHGILVGGSHLTTIQNNFIYANGGDGIHTNTYTTPPLNIIGNYFLKNKGGVFVRQSNSGVKITSNDFYQNSSYIIKNDANSGEQITYLATDNWFGIDTGASLNKGQYFVASDFDVSSFASEQHNFSFRQKSAAALTYTDYLGAGPGGSDSFGVTVERKSLTGSPIIPGSLQLYTVTLRNLTTRATKDIILTINIPVDQELLLCSVVSTTRSQSYDLEKSCTGVLSPDVQFARGKLILSPDSIAALSTHEFYIVTVLKASAKSASLPSMTFEQAGMKRTIPYRLNTTTNIRKGFRTTSITKKAPARRMKDEPPKVIKTIDKPVPVLVSPILVPTERPLVTGTVKRRVKNGLLQYILWSDSGRGYLMLNGAKWQEIDAFTRGADSSKRIAVYGKYGYGKSGKRSLIMFTDFEVLP